MGVNYETKVVIGVRTDKLLHSVKEKTTVTKYNPDTGIPYQLDKYEDKFFWLGKEVDRSVVDDIEDIIKPFGLDLYYAQEYEDNVIGKELNLLNPGEFTSYSFKEIQNKLYEVQQLFNKMWNGCPSTSDRSDLYPMTEVKLYVISTAG